MELKLREREKEIAREKETIDGQVAGKLRLERGEQIGRVMQSTFTAEDAEDAEKKGSSERTTDQTANER